MNKKYEVNPSSKITIFKYNGDHPFIKYISDELVKVNGVRKAYLFYLKQGFFKRKNLFVSICYISNELKIKNKDTPALVITHIIHSAKAEAVKKGLQK